jgi:hypothetical protein
MITLLKRRLKPKFDWKLVNNLEKLPLKSNSRPRIVTWLASGVLILSILFIVRFFLSFQIPDLPLTTPQWYFSLTGFAWGLFGLILSYGLFQTFPWAFHTFFWGSLSFMVWYWIDRLLFARSDYSQVSWPASAILTVLSLGFLLWVQRRADIKAVFKENDK